MSYACIWKAPFTSVQVLKTLSPGGVPNLRTFPQAITSDGSTVFGSARHPDGRWRAVKWDTTTLAVTILEEIFTDTDQFAAACSANGSVVVGGTQSSGGISRMTRWTGGGASGAPFVGRNSSSTIDLGTGGGSANAPVPSIVSDDGTICTGFETYPSGVTFVGATFWRNGVATQLPGAAWTSVADPAAQGHAVSANGQVIVGNSGYDNISTGPQFEGDACYWTNLTGTPVLHRLIVPTEIVNKGFNAGFACNGDGSAIWGRVADGVHIYPPACLYTNVTTPTGDGVHFGSYQLLARLPNTQGIWSRQSIFRVAHDPGIVIAVGSDSYDANDTHACKWTGASVTDLGTLPGYNTAEATGCNHDGSVVCGYSVDGANTGVLWAVRWDASNVIHKLPTLADPALAMMGDAWGVSRDGSVIFGLMDVADIEEVITTTVAELWFGQTAGYIDLTSASNRRHFYSEKGGAKNLGTSGQIPFGGPPPVFLTRTTDPSTFTVNNGRGGSFPLSEGSLEESDSNPPGDLEIEVRPGAPGRGVLGDYRNGNLYAFNTASYLDNGTQRKWIRRWRALPEKTTKATRFSYLAIKMQTGSGVRPGAVPQMMLRWSDDGGHAWSDYRIVEVGRSGQTAFTVKFNRLGSTSRFRGSNRIFELSSTDPFQVALLDAEVDVS